MRRSETLLATLLLLGCTLPAVARGQSNAAGSGKPVAEQKASTAVPLEFLLDSAAKDFRANPPHPAGFRHVRVGHVTSGVEGTMYMLCGEFLPAQEKGKPEWTPFVTIKTSGYEQYLGAQAASFCKRPGVVWDKSGDLTSTLQSRLQSKQ